MPYAIPWWDPRTYDATQYLESGPRRGDYNYSNTKGNLGPMQYGQRDWQQWGGGGNVFSYADARAAAQREFAANAKAHQARFGREMTGDEGYFYHQQGPPRGGGGALLAADPNALAWQVLRPLYRSDREAQTAISNNVLGNLRSQFPNPLAITAGQFRDMWRDRFQRQIGAPLGVPPPVQPPAEQPPLLQVASGAPIPGRMGAGLSSLIQPSTGGSFGIPMPQDLLSRAPGRRPTVGPQEYADPSPPLPPLADREFSYPPPQPNIPLPYYPDMPAPGPYGDQRPDITGGALSGDLTPPPPAPPPDLAPGEPEPPGPPMPGGRPYTPEERAALEEGIRAFQGRSIIPGPGMVTEQGAAPAVPGLPQVPVKSVPTTTTGPAQPQAQAPVDNSILARMGFPGVAAWGRAVQTSPAFMGGLGGLMYGAPGFSAGLSGATAAGHLDIAQRQEGRAAELFGRGTADYNRQLAAYNAAFPNGPEGPPNMDHPLLKGLTPQAAQTVASAGVVDGTKFLREYQLKDAEGRAEMLRKLETIQTLRGRGGQQAQPTAPPQLAPTGPVVPPDLPGYGQPSIMGGVPISTGAAVSQRLGAAPAPRAPAPAAPAGGGGAGGGATLPPAGAMPQLPPIGGRGAGYTGVQGGPGGFGAEPWVYAFGEWMPYSEAQGYQQALEAVGIKNTGLEKAIEQAGAPGQQYAKTLAESEAKQEASKPAARVALSTAIETISGVQALAKKIHDDPELPRATGKNADPYDDPRQERVTKIPFTTMPWHWENIKAQGDPARRVSDNMRTLANQLGLAALHALQASNKTGASGLGSTGEQEINMLKSATVGVLDPTIRTEDYQHNLNIILNATENLKQRLLQGWQEQYREPFKQPGGNEPIPYPSRAEEVPPEARLTKSQRRRAEAQQAAAAKADEATWLEEQVRDLKPGETVTREYNGQKRKVRRNPMTGKGQYYIPEPGEE